MRINEGHRGRPMCSTGQTGRTSRCGLPVLRMSRTIKQDVAGIAQGKSKFAMAERGFSMGLKPGDFGPVGANGNFRRHPVNRRTKRPTFDDIPDNKSDGGLLPPPSRYWPEYQGHWSGRVGFHSGRLSAESNPQYGQSVVDANQTAVNRPGGSGQPWTAVCEAGGNAADSMGTMRARVAGQLGSRRRRHSLLDWRPANWRGWDHCERWADRCGGVRRTRDTRNGDSSRPGQREGRQEQKAIAALGAATVRGDRNQVWPAGMGPSHEEGRSGAPTTDFGRKPCGGGGQGQVKGAAIEGAEELSRTR